MDMELLFPSKYLKACDLQGRDVTVTMLRVELAELTMRGGATKKRGVITLAKTEKAMVLNRTNAESIAKLYGRDTDKWIGCSITLYPARVPFGAAIVDTIRLRERVPTTRAARTS